MMYHGIHNGIHIHVCGKTQSIVTHRITYMITKYDKSMMEVMIILIMIFIIGVSFMFLDTCYIDKGIQVYRYIGVSAYRYICVYVYTCLHMYTYMNVRFVCTERRVFTCVW